MNSRRRTPQNTEGVMISLRSLALRRLTVFIHMKTGIKRKAPLRIDSDPVERREFNSALSPVSLTMSERPAAAREVIADCERQHDEQPEHSRYDNYLCQARTPAHVHEDQHDRRRLDHGDGQRDDSVEHPANVSNQPDVLEFFCEVE